MKQRLHRNTSSPIVNHTEHAVNKDFSTIDSSIIIKEEGKELHGTSESSDLPLVLHERRSDNSEKIEVEKALLLYVFNLNKYLFTILLCLNVLNFLIS